MLGGFMAKVFIMQGKRAGQSIQLMGRYNFVNGVHLEEDDDTAKMKQAVLTKFYPCEMMDHAEYVKQQALAAKTAASAKEATVAKEPAPAQVAKGSKD